MKAYSVDKIEFLRSINLLTWMDADLSGTIHKYLAVALRFSLMKIARRLRQRY